MISCEQIICKSSLFCEVHKNWLCVLLTKFEWRDILQHILYKWIGPLPRIYISTQILFEKANFPVMGKIPFSCKYMMSLRYLNEYWLGLLYRCDICSTRRSILSLSLYLSFCVFVFLCVAETFIPLWYMFQTEKHFVFVFAFVFLCEAETFIGLWYMFHTDNTYFCRTGFCSNWPVGGR